MACLSLKEKKEGKLQVPSRKEVQEDTDTAHVQPKMPNDMARHHMRHLDMAPDAVGHSLSYWG